MITSGPLSLHDLPDASSGQDARVADGGAADASSGQDARVADGGFADSGGHDAAFTYGSYEQGPYHCCAEGEGTACCAGYDRGLCFEFGGVYEACRGPDEEFEAQVICSKCCEGLLASSQLIVGNTRAVERLACTSHPTCVRSFPRQSAILAAGRAPRLHLRLLRAPM